MRFFRRSKVGAVALILLAFPAALVWITMGGKSVEAGLTSGAPVHSHSGTTTGGSTLTRPNISNASALTLSTSNNAQIISLGTSGTVSYTRTNGATGQLSLWLDQNALFPSASVNPLFSNATSGANNGFQLRNSSLDGADNGFNILCGSGACAVNRGAMIELHGNETSTGGVVRILSGDVAGISSAALLAGTAGIGAAFDGATDITSGAGTNIAINPGLAITTTGRFVSTAACAAGYTRKTPNYCQRNSVFSGTALVRDTCTAIAAPANSLILSLNITSLLTASGSPVAATRETFTTTYSDATCTTIINQITHQTLQRAADANGGIQNMTQHTESGENVSGSYYIKFVDDTGNSNTVSYAINGYYD